MSVFLKGKNVENLTRDTWEAVKSIAKMRLREELRVCAHDINELLQTGELTVEQANQEWHELKKQFEKEKRRIENWPFAERVNPNFGSGSAKVRSSPFSHPSNTGSTPLSEVVSK